MDGNQGKIQESYWMSDDALCNFLPLPIVAKSSILNATEFLDSSLETLSCMKASPVLGKNQSFFNIFKCDHSNRLE